jgi:hypothetical protein
MKFLPLSETEQDAVIKCMASLDAAPLQKDSDSEVDLNGLNDVVGTFVKEFAPWTKNVRCLPPQSRSSIDLI